MNTTTPLHRRTPAITGIAALGLVTTVMLAPAAHADTERDGPEGSASTAVVANVDGAAGATVEEPAAEAPREADTGAGDEAAPETGDQATAGTGEETASEAGGELSDAEAAPAEAGPADETEAIGTPEQDGLCADGAAGGAAGDQEAAETGTAAPTDSGLTEGTAEEGADSAPGVADAAAGLPDAASSGDGAVMDPACAAIPSVEADNGSGPRGGDETQLPVGGVDAGKGEAVSQNMVLPVAAAGAAAAAVSLGAFTLVRRRRSDA
jgi:hypothetical protein